MIFKTHEMQIQFDAEINPWMRSLLREIDKFCVDVFGREIFITRLTGAVEGESGVHIDGRGADLRFQHAGKTYFTEEEAEFIVYIFNKRYPRSDKKPTIFLHGKPKHFHVQLAPSMTVYLPGGFN